VKCKICSYNSQQFAEARVLDKYNVRYFRCPHCGFIQTEAPYWLEEAYSQKITDSDIGLVNRNLYLARTSRVLVSTLFDTEARFLDYGGGYGLFVRIMRDSGFDFYLWDKYSSTNLFAQGFEAELNDQDDYELVTAFEVFEHFLDPLEDIRQALTFSKDIFFSTQLVPPNVPQPGEWWYYGLEHGQHVSLYTSGSLVALAKRLDLNFLTNGRSLHLLTGRNVSPALFRFILRGRVTRLLDSLINKDSLLARDYYQLTGRELR
jgi:hypothetical protein